MRCLFVLLPLLVLPACSLRVGGSQGLDKVADDLRAENVALREELENAKLQVSELKSQLAASAGGASALPGLAVVEIDGLSGPSRDGSEFNVSIETLDGSRRFVPIAGSIVVQLFASADAGVPIAERGVEGRTLADAYRSSFMGTHYRVDIPLPESARGATEMLIRAKVTDAASAREFVAEWMWNVPK